MWITLAILLAFIIFKRTALLAWMGQTRYSAGDLAGALKYHRAAERLGTLPDRAAVFYGYLLLREGMVEESRKRLSYLSLYAKKPEVKMQAKASLAILLNKEGKTEEAIELLEKVYSFGRSTVNYGSLGHMYLAANRPEALPFNREAYEYNSDDNIICGNYALALLRSGDTARAEEIFQEAIAREPKFPEIYVDYAQLLSESGRNAEAAEQLEKALACRWTYLTSISVEAVTAELERIRSVKFS